MKLQSFMIKKIIKLDSIHTRLAVIALILLLKRWKLLPASVFERV